MKAQGAGRTPHPVDGGPAGLPLMVETQALGEGTFAPNSYELTVLGGPLGLPTGTGSPLESGQAQ